MSAESASNDNGIAIGIVSDLADPEELGRIRVKFPHLDDQQSHWARLALPMAGPDRGFHFVPEVGDEVLVGSLHGDTRFLYILGSLWSTVDKPPAHDGKIKENNWRFIKSRSGHIIKLDDTSGKEKIELLGKGDKHRIVIDVSGDKIQITADSGDIEIKAAAGKVQVDASEIAVKATGNMSLEAGGQMTIKGKTVNIN